MSEAITLFLIILTCAIIAGIHMYEEKHVYDVKMHHIPHGLDEVVHLNKKELLRS